MTLNNHGIRNESKILNKKQILIHSETDVGFHIRGSNSKYSIMRLLHENILKSWVQYMGLTKKTF